jgi:hypothetical protein
MYLGRVFLVELLLTEVGTGLLTVLEEELKLGTEAGLELAVGMLISGVEGLFSGVIDLVELVVTIVIKELIILLF